MALTEITALARLVARSNPRDRAEQARNLMRIQELRDLMMDRHAEGLATCLEAAALLVDHLARPREVSREQLHEVISLLIAMVEKSYVELLAMGRIDEIRGEKDGLGEQPRTVTIDPSPEPCLPMINDMVLGEVMVELGAVTREDVRRALEEQSRSQKPFGQTLVDIGAANLNQVQSALHLQRELRTRAIPPQLLTGPTKLGSKVRLRVVGEREVDPDDCRERLLGEILIQSGAIGEEQLERSLGVQRATGKRLGEALVELGATTWKEVEKAVCMQRRLRYVAGLPAEAEPGPPLAS